MGNRVVNVLDSLGMHVEISVAPNDDQSHPVRVMTISSQDGAHLYTMNADNARALAYELLMVAGPGPKLEFRDADADRVRDRAARGRSGG